MVREREASMDVKRALREFITDSILPSARVNAFDDHDSFMAKGILDSTGVLELLEHIEKSFGIRVEDHEIIPDNLDSLNKLVVFIERKMGHVAA